MTDYEHDWPSFQTTLPTTSDRLRDYDEVLDAVIHKVIGSKEDPLRVREAVVWAHAYGNKLVLYTRRDVEGGEILTRAKAAWTDCQGPEATVETRWVGHCVYREVQAGGPSSRVA